MPNLKSLVSNILILEGISTTLCLTKKQIDNLASFKETLEISFDDVNSDNEIKTLFEGYPSVINFTVYVSKRRRNTGINLRKKQQLESIMEYSINLNSMNKDALESLVNKIQNKETEITRTCTLLDCTFFIDSTVPELTYCEITQDGMVSELIEEPRTKKYYAPLQRIGRTITTFYKKYNEKYFKGML